MECLRGKCGGGSVELNWLCGMVHTFEDGAGDRFLRSGAFF